jgi:uncharacterized RDD family membrane protein YckC
MADSDTPQAQWFYTLKGEHAGPISEAEMLTMHEQRQLRGSDLVWSQGMKGWKPLDEVLPKIMRVIPVKPTPPPVPANPNIEQAEVGEEYVIPQSPFDAARSVGHQENSRRAWQRFVARMFDGIFYVVIAGVVLAALFSEHEIMQAYENLSGFSMYNILMMLVLGVLEAFMISKWGMTPGKWIMRVRVVHSEQRFLSFSEALKRYFYVLVRGMGLGLFPLNAIFNTLSYVEVTQTGNTLWDKRLECEVQHGQMLGIHRASAWVLSTIMVLVILAMIG